MPFFGGNKPGIFWHVLRDCGILNWSAFSFVKGISDKWDNGASSLISRWISSSPRTPAELLLSLARLSARPADGAREKFSGWNGASAHPGEEERVLNGFSLSRVPLRIITAAAAQHLSAGIPVVPPFWSNNIEKRCPSFISAPSHSRVSKLTLATQGVSGRRFGKKQQQNNTSPFFICFIQTVYNVLLC